MTRRRLAWVGLAVCLAVVVGIWRASRPHPVNRENYERIQIGMTQAEVEAVLECPPGNYATGRLVLGPATNVWRHRWTRWYSDDGQIGVEFDAEGRVKDSWFDTPVFSKPPGPLDRLRAWLGW